MVKNTSDSSERLRKKINLFGIIFVNTLIISSIVGLIFTIRYTESHYANKMREIETISNNKFSKLIIENFTLFNVYIFPIESDVKDFATTAYFSKCYNNIFEDVSKLVTQYSKNECPIKIVRFNRNWYAIIDEANIPPIVAIELVYEYQFHKIQYIIDFENKIIKLDK